MNESLATEQIYDSIFDDDLLAELPKSLNRAYGARSCTLHWWHALGEAEVMAHSGHFTDEQMLNYATNFAETDLWSLEGLRPERANRVWNCDAIVPAAVYEKGVFYNEWIRPMGDDTYHCMGIAMHTRWGFGFIGLHRGIAQGGFSDTALEALNRDVTHLRRMLTLRGRLANVTRTTEGLASGLDALGQPMFLVDAQARVKHFNSAAAGMLGQQLYIRDGVLHASDPQSDRGLKRAVAHVFSKEGPAASAVSVACNSAKQIHLSIVATPYSEGARLCLIAAGDCGRPDPTAAHRLRLLYGLSRGEADVAVFLADGHSPASIAEQRQVTIATVRQQMKCVSAKLGCSRQSEIVALVKSLPPLFCR